jgi:hypothetical protein
MQSGQCWQHRHPSSHRTSLSSAVIASGAPMKSISSVPIRKPGGVMKVPAEERLEEHPNNVKYSLEQRTTYNK